MCDAVCTGRFPVNEARIDVTSGKDSSDGGIGASQMCGWNLQKLRGMFYIWPMDILSMYELIKFVASFARFHQ